MTKGTALIDRERDRQITEEGYTVDDDYGNSDNLARAGAAYAIPAIRRSTHKVGNFEHIPALWPWNPDSWKPTPKDRLRELVKAGALIAAAIDSLLDSESR